MPIKFRCPHCQQFLGISRSRAGAVTDCPTCGRSIRIPLLDGSVPPLPEPELNLADGGLASALEKLAGLAEGENAEEPAAGVESVAVLAVQATVERGVVQAVPLPEPIVLEPAPAPVVIEPAPVSPPPGPQRSAERPPAAAFEQIVESIAAGGTAGAATHRQAAPTKRSAPDSRRRLLPLAALAIMAVIAFAGGFAVGRRSTPSTESTPTVPAAAPPAAVLPQRGEAAAVDPALTGRVSYVAAGGETRPDAGARVLVLPEERQGSTRLAADGLRSGAAEPDQRVALAAIRALGGDFCIAGEDGRYTIQLPQAGIYQVVIVSRYQSRGGDAAPAEALQFLSRYFDRPAQVLGDAAVHISQFRYRGSGTSPRDQTFELR